MPLGDNVREERKKQGLTQEQVARKADVTLNTLFKIEKNRLNPSFLIVDKIAKALNISMDSLRDNE